MQVAAICRFAAVLSGVAVKVRFIGQLHESFLMKRPVPAQIRAARALLDWSMADMAKAAHISVAAVHRYERNGHQTVSSDAVTLMQDTLEMEGVLFLADEGSGPGVRCKRC